MAHILDTPGPGGAESMLVSLAEGLEGDGFESVFFIRENSWMHKQLRNGENAFFLPGVRSFDPGFVRSLVGAVKSRNVDIVHSHEFLMNTYGTFAASLAGRPSIATVHGQLDYVLEKRRRRTAYRWVARTGCLVAVSHQLAKSLAEKIGVPEERIRTIHNGIPTEKFRTRHDLRKLRSELGIAEESPVVGMVGNLYPVKGYEYFLKAAQMVKHSFSEAVFLICGRGELQSQLESQAAECGLSQHVRFLGFRDDVPALLQLMDVFVLSSLSEGLSLSVMEAMASGKPTVVTDVGGNREIVAEGETGFVVPPKDAGELAEKICVLLRDKSLSERFGTNGRKRVDSLFSLNKMVSDYQELYRSLAG